MRPSKLISPLAIRGMHYQSYAKPELLLLRPKRSRKQRRDPSFVFNLWLRARFLGFCRPLRFNYSEQNNEGR